MSFCRGWRNEKKLNGNRVDAPGSSERQAGNQRPGIGRKPGKKRGRCCQRPEFREETPKKGEATIACCNATLAQGPTCCKGERRRRHKKYRIRANCCSVATTFRATGHILLLGDRHAPLEEPDRKKKRATAKKPRAFVSRQSRIAEHRPQEPRPQEREHPPPALTAIEP